MEGIERREGLMLVVRVACLLPGRRIPPCKTPRGGAPRGAEA